MVPRPGALELLKALETAGIPVIIVSAGLSDVPSSRSRTRARALSRTPRPQLRASPRPSPKPELLGHRGVAPPTRRAEREPRHLLQPSQLRRGNPKPSPNPSPNPNPKPSPNPNPKPHLEGARVPRGRRRGAVLEGDRVLPGLGFALDVGLGLALRS